MQYTPHYNLNLPEGTDIVNPLIQDNPNYTAIDTALYNNKLRVVGTATHVKTGTNHAITLGDSDINQFKFVATGDYASGDTFTVDGVTVTARVADGSSIPSGAFKINSTVLAILDGTILNLIGLESNIDPQNIILSNGDNVDDALTQIDSNACPTINIPNYLNGFIDWIKYGRVVTLIITGMHFSDQDNSFKSHIVSLSDLGLPVPALPTNDRLSAVSSENGIVGGQIWMTDSALDIRTVSTIGVNAVLTYICN